MMSNVVLMFSPTDEKTPYEAGRESYSHTVQSVATRLIVHNFLNVHRNGPTLIEYFLNGFYCELYV